MPPPYPDLLGSIDWLTIVSIPLVTGLVGWFTNWLAIEMMFRPLKRRGVGVLGWHGVIPSRAPKMAQICVDTMTERLITAQELVNRIDPSAVSDIVAPELGRRSERIVEEVVRARYPALWNTMPLTLRDKTLSRMKAEVPGVVTAMTNDVRHDADELVDLREMVISAFTNNVALLCELFRRCGGEEFRFIARCGLGFGLLFGGVQLVIWLIVQPWWFLPVTGAIVGWATNWLALRMVFKPLHPKRMFFVTWHGLFLKRQNEVADEYARFFASQILRAETLMDAVLRGPASDRLFAMVHRHISRAIDEVAGPGRPVMQFVVGTRRYVELKDAICDRVAAEIPAAARRMHAYADEALDIESTLRDRLQALPAEQFEQVLHPVFEEDEWLLIAVGAALGFVAGCIQLAVVTFF